ncbi:MAG: ribose 5-phosphate isomerase A [Chitinophagales bacterium]
METQTMDLKKEVALHVVRGLPRRGIVGLGAGSTIAHLVAALDPKNRELAYISSSVQTNQLLIEKGFNPIPLGSVSAIDLYFDGCDQLDHELNALKSGGGIHTHEKLLASMAKEFIILIDESKWVETFSPNYPLVLELIPEAEAFVHSKLIQVLKSSDIRVREDKTRKKPAITANGNRLLDIWFDRWPALSGLNESLESIAGVLEIYLFYQMAARAMIGTMRGVKEIERNRS